ncbi:MAG TPA: serine/threonine-protein kinase [Polyangiaceae bacterium]|nr:serine/threonine-protein kinase [Polyangiaceae bacterium]
MGNRHSQDEKDAEESTTLVHSGSSGARLKAALDLASDAKVRLVEPHSNDATPHFGPNSGDEFAQASVALPVAPPVASSGMVGPYHLALEIASGGMATVYLAVHGLEGFQNTVAVKRIHPHLAKDKEFVDMFADEAHIAARINHPYVCRVFDFGKTADNSYYIAMEFLRGEPLSRVFKSLTPERVCNPRHPMIIARVIANLAEGLHAAHILKDTQGISLEVVHRDITPQNLFVLSDGTVRVTDFGIARARVRSHQTQGGRIKGKLAYMSPEQLNQQPVDRRSDIWGLGVVAWELLTGRRLFRASSEGETVLSVLTRPIPPPSRFADSVPRKLDEIVQRALSRDPETRYSSARDLTRALEAFLAAAGDTVPTMDVADWVEDLFPGAGSRSDGLVRLAHAVIPPERRSVRPLGKHSVPPGVGPGSGSAPMRAERQPTPSNLPVLSTAAPSELRWGRALLLTAALLAAVAGVAVFASRRQSASVTRFSPPAAAAQPVAERSFASLAVEIPASNVPGVVEVPRASISATGAAPSSSAPRTETASSKPPALVATAVRRAVASAPSAAPPLAMEKTGSVQLMTRNGRAEVYLGARLLGTTPLTVDLPTGTVSLLLKPIAGGEPRSVNVAIQPGATSFISVPLSVPVP